MHTMTKQQLRHFPRFSRCPSCQANKFIESDSTEPLHKQAWAVPGKEHHSMLVVPLLLARGNESALTHHGPHPPSRGNKQVA